MKTQMMIQEWLHFVGFAAVMLMLAALLVGWAGAFVVGACWLINVVLIKQGLLWVSHQTKRS